MMDFDKSKLDKYTKEELFYSMCHNFDCLKHLAIVNVKYLKSTVEECLESNIEEKDFVKIQFLTVFSSALIYLMQEQDILLDILPDEIKEEVIKMTNAVKELEEDLYS